MTELNYQELVDGYYENLNNNLRHFKGGPGFLETWVHDEDHGRSLLEILCLAASQNVGELVVQLPLEVSSSLNWQWLESQSAPYGLLSKDTKGLRFVPAPGKATGHGK